MKRIWIPLFIGVFISACGFLGESIPFLDGPNVASQKKTQLSMTLQADAQQAIIQTQVAEGLAILAAATAGGAAQNDAAVPTASLTPAAAGAEETRAAEKTAVMSNLLTAAALTPSPAPMQSGGGFATAAPQIDPKASDGTDFTGAHFYSWGQWDPKTYAVTIELSGPVGGQVGKNFIMKVNGKALEKCIVPLEYPNRLYCTGSFNGGNTIEIFENVGGQEALRFMTHYNLPSWTITPTKAPKKDRATKTPEP